MSDSLALLRIFFISVCSFKLDISTQVKGQSGIQTNVTYFVEVTGMS